VAFLSLKGKALTRLQAAIVAVVVVVVVVAAVAYYYTTLPAPSPAPTPTPAPSPAPSPAPAPAPTPTKEYILVGASIPLSGGLAYNGEEEKAGLEMAIEDINAKGGVYVATLGKRLPIKLIYYDDGTDPTKSKSNAERLVTVDGVDFLVGDFGTTQVFAVATVAEQYQVPYIPIGTGSIIYEQKKYNWTFIPFHTEWTVLEPIFKLLSELPSDVRPTKIAIWQEDTTIGADNAAAVKYWVEKYSPMFTIVLHEKYTPRQADYSSLILKTKEARAEIVFAVPTVTDAVTLIRQSKELGFFPKLFAFQRAAEPADFWKLLGEDAQGVIAGVPGHPKLPIKKTQEVVEKYRSKYGKEPGLVVCPAYAIIEILAAAIEKAGTLDRNKVREALCTLELDTVIGHVKFNGPGHATVEVIAYQWQNGKQEIVYPPKYATAKPIFRSAP